MSAGDEAGKTGAPIVGPYLVHDQESAQAFWKHWRDNFGKHGFYEATWGALTAAIRAGFVSPEMYREREAAAASHAALKERVALVEKALGDLLCVSETWYCAYCEHHGVMFLPHERGQTPCVVQARELLAPTSAAGEKGGV